MTVPLPAEDLAALRADLQAMPLARLEGLLWDLHPQRLSDNGTRIKPMAPEVLAVLREVLVQRQRGAVAHWGRYQHRRPWRAPQSLEYPLMRLRRPTVRYLGEELDPEALRRVYRQTQRVLELLGAPSALAGAHRPESLDRLVGVCRGDLCQPAALLTGQLGGVHGAVSCVQPALIGAEAERQAILDPLAGDVHHPQRQNFAARMGQRLLSGPRGGASRRGTHERDHPALCRCRGVAAIHLPLLGVLSQPPERARAAIPPLDTDLFGLDGAPAAAVAPADPPAPIIAYGVGPPLVARVTPEHVHWLIAPGAPTGGGLLKQVLASNRGPARCQGREVCQQLIPAARPAPDPPPPALAAPVRPVAAAEHHRRVAQQPDVAVAGISCW